LDFKIIHKVNNKFEIINTFNFKVMKHPILNFDNREFNLNLQLYQIFPPFNSINNDINPFILSFVLIQLST